MADYINPNAVIERLRRNVRSLRRNGHDFSKYSPQAIAAMANVQEQAAEWIETALSHLWPLNERGGEVNVPFPRKRQEMEQKSREKVFDAVSRGEG